MWPELGPGRGFALATREYLVVVPTFLVVGRRTLPDQLDAALAGERVDGATWPLAATQRISFRTGFLRRRVAFRVDRDTVISVRPTRAELASFQQLFSGDPRVV